MTCTELWLLGVCFAIRHGREATLGRWSAERRTGSTANIQVYGLHWILMTESRRLMLCICADIAHNSRTEERGLARASTSLSLHADHRLLDAAPLPAVPPVASVDSVCCTPGRSDSRLPRPSHWQCPNGKLPCSRYVHSKTPCFFLRLPTSRRQACFDAGFGANCKA